MENVRGNKGLTGLDKHAPLSVSCECTTLSWAHRQYHTFQKANKREKKLRTLTRISKQRLKLQCPRTLTKVGGGKLTLGHWLPRELPFTTAEAGRATDVDTRCEARLAAS